MEALIQPLRLRGADGTGQGRKVTWLELFFDLAFVAAVAQVGTPLAGDYSVPGLVRYTVLFVLIWWAWSGHTNFSTRFESDDVVQRALTLTQIFVVAVMAVNAKDALDSRSSAGFAAAYALMRFVLVAQYCRARRILASRRLTTAYATGFGVAAVCWLVSALVPAPARFWLWGAALLIDLGTPIVTAHLSAEVPPDPDHLPERFGLFTIILLGESMVAVMKGMESQEGWSVTAASAAFLGIVTPFLVWWWYFDGVEGAAERVVRTKRDAQRFTVWSFAHLPLYLGIALSGVGLEHIIRIAPDGHLHRSEIWILSGAVVLLMSALVTIGAASGHGCPRVTRPRLVAQYVVSAAPLAAGFVDVHTPPVFLAGGIVLLCLVQLALARPARPNIAPVSAVPQPL
ncbi:MAG TPA: low temperature requirement protein A [Vicinamibacterales bacterium]|nr:low temperature requirement protein A [Vicinamibacterales bacterium]